jgi:hypothetical protein
MMNEQEQTQPRPHRQYGRPRKDKRAALLDEGWTELEDGLWAKPGYRTGSLAASYRRLVEGGDNVIGKKQTETIEEMRARLKAMGCSG